MHGSGAGQCGVGLKCTCGYTLATSTFGSSHLPGPYRARADRGWPGVVGVLLVDNDGCDAGTVGRTALRLETRRVELVAVVYRNWIAGVPE